MPELGAFERLRQLELPQRDFAITIFSIDDGLITFGNRWAIGDFDTDTLIDSMELFEGLQYVSADKIIANRRKDRQHWRAMRNGGYLD